MNHRLKRILQSLLVNDICWAIASPFVYAGKRLSLSRENYKNRKTEDENLALCSEIFSSKTVLHGLLKGLVYNGIEATGSSIYAKLLGSYEMEIMPALQSLLSRPYSNFVNIGSDEGFYAVGVARLLPGIHVVAFDCNKRAQEKCRELAETNKVEDRVVVKGCFNMKELLLNNKPGKTLFIIDCEGCENEMITKEFVDHFKNADLVIELHYEQGPMILSKLNGLFAATHRITVIKALTDHERVMNYRFTELDHLSYEQKKFILNERDGYMEWFVAEALTD